MGDPERTYTVEQANALLPHVAPLLVELREKFEEAGRIRAAIARAAASDGHSLDRPEWSRTLARVAELMERLDEWDIQLRDVSTGLIDFPSEIEGEPALLCWRLGEESVAWWHRPEDGFGGRRPL